MKQMNRVNRNTIALKGIILSLTLSFIPSLATLASSEQTSQVLKLSENKRIEASICGTSMNRITVANDRITQLFGDDGTFESQNDETTGQVFLKPTLENGSKNLSLTLITEQGITQDLTLKPDALSAKTLILTRDPADQALSLKSATEQNPYKKSPKHNNAHSHLGYNNTLPLQEESRLEQILILLKQAMNGQLPAHEEEYPITDHPSPQGYALTHTKAWRVGPYVIHTLTVENLTDDPLPLQEKDFYQPGDLALSFEVRVLNAHQLDIPTFQPRNLDARKEVSLYVVRFGGRANHD